MKLLTEASQISRKNVLYVGAGIAFFIALLIFDVYKWVVYRIYLPMEIFFGVMFLLVLIERAKPRYVYEMQQKSLFLTKYGLFGKKILEVNYKDVVGIYNYKPQLISVIKFRHTYRMHSSLDGRNVWTIAYTVLNNKGKKENIRIYFKPSEAMLQALREIMPSKVKVSENKVVLDMIKE